MKQKHVKNKVVTHGMDYY